MTKKKKKKTAIFFFENNEHFGLPAWALLPNIE